MPANSSGSSVLCALLTVAVLIGSAAVPGTSRASAQDAAGIDITSVVADDWPTVQASVIVADSGDRPITGLTPEAFTASIAGKTVPVTSLQTTSDPGTGIAVVLTFDTSGSMAGEPMESAKAAAAVLIDQLGPSDQAAVIAFASQVSLVQPLTGDRAALKGAVEALTAGGDTALYAAVEESVRVAASAPLPRRAVVLLSDGVNFGASGDPATSLAAVQQGTAFFMSIGLGPAIDIDYLSQLAAGHGQLRVAPSPGDLTALYQQTSDVLRQQYVLTLDASGIGAQTAATAPLRIEAAAGGVVLAAETTLTLPAQAIQPAATPPPATSAPTPAPSSVTRSEPAATDESGSGGLPLAAVVVVVAGVAAGLAAVIMWRRRGNQRRAVPELMVERLERDERPLAFPTIVRAVPEDRATAWLEVSPDQRIPVGDAPVVIGFGADCTFQLRNGQPGKVERARIWRREGAYMLHNLTRSGGVSIGGRPVTWAVLEDGDEIEIGGCTMVFRQTTGADTP